MSGDAAEVKEISTGYVPEAEHLSVPSGYKQPEAGVIPHDWNFFQIGDVSLKVGSGVTPTGGSRVYTHSGVPFVRSQNVGWGVLKLEDVAYIAPDLHATFNGTEIKDNDVLLNITGASIGRAAIVDERIVGGNVNQHVCIVRPDARFLEPRFLAAFLISDNGQRQIDSFQAGGNRQGLNFNQVRSIRLAVPREIKEQRAIAASLSDVDALLEELDRLIAKKRDLKQATMQQLLTGQTRLPGFDGEWKEVTMRDVLVQAATYGIVTAGRFVSNGVKMLRGGDISDGRISTDLPMVSDEKSFEYQRTVVRENDIVIALVGYPGAAAVVPLELAGANISRAVGLLRLNSEVDPSFMTFFLNSPDGRKMVLAPSAGSAQLVVNLSALNKLMFRIPPIDEQLAIAEILEFFDEEFVTLNLRRRKALALKQAMMSELLTGRTRLL